MKAIPSSESIGKTYGKLTVIADRGMRPIGERRKAAQVLCRCECGNEKVVLVNDLRCGKTKTCGFEHPHYDDRTLPAFNFVYDHGYRARALKKGLRFDLTRDRFRVLTQSNCYYCGAPPSSGSTRGIKTGKNLSTYVANGIDRKNNALGYTPENCVPCCGTCNHAKHTMSVSEFLMWVWRVYQHSLE